jgi:uncharacterized integral membrane protein (TIGR00697 family)
VTAGKLFTFEGMVLSASILVYPLNSIFGDVLTEVYGFNRTRRLIWMGLISGLLFLVATQIAIILPPAESYTAQEAFATINGIIPRIVLASYIAYLGCEFTNSAIMSKMKIWQKARNFSYRAMVSTAAAQLVDSSLFFLIGFWDAMPHDLLLMTIISSWLLKTGYELLALPFTSVLTRGLKHLEGIEHFDRYTLHFFKF